MRKVIFAINITVVWLLRPQNNLSTKKNLNILLTSRERLTCRSLGAKPIN